MNETHAFMEFPKIARLSRECVITEKIDGTNAQIYITEDGQFFTGSRTRWIKVGDDNAGFAFWANQHKDELMTLGPGQHFGEWWGSGIQRGYNLPKGEKRFSLFNTIRWVMPGHPKTEKQEVVPPCCHVVPELYRGTFDTVKVQEVLNGLKANGSSASPGFMNPEGIVIFHIAAQTAFKKTIEKDEQPKGFNG